MIELLLYLQRQPWWESRFMWGYDAAEALVIDAVWHSRFKMADIWDMDHVL